jgi:hypothetical protein
VSPNQPEPDGAPEGRSLSSVVPVLVAALVCDVAVKEPATGKSCLIGIFDRVHTMRFPSARPMTLYLKLTDAEGAYQLVVRYVHLDTGAVIAEAHTEVVATNRLESVDGHVDFGQLALPRPGRYEFQVLANDVYIGSAFIDAVAHAGAATGG